LEFDVTSNNSTVASPCVGQCDQYDGVCMGCFRDIHEIADWHDMSDEQRRTLLAKLDERRKEAEALN